MQLTNIQICNMLNRIPDCSCNLVITKQGCLFSFLKNSALISSSESFLLSRMKKNAFERLEVGAGCSHIHSDGYSRIVFVNLIASALLRCLVQRGTILHLKKRLNCYVYERRKGVFEYMKNTLSNVHISIINTAGKTRERTLLVLDCSIMMCILQSALSMR